MEVTVPDPADLETSKTFEVTLPIRYYDFVLPKPPKVKKAKSVKGDEAVKEGKEGDADGADASAEAGSGEDKPAEDGEGGEGEGEKKEGEEEEEEEEEPEAEEEHFPVVHAQYLPGESSKFLLSLSGKAAGKLFECDFDDPSSIMAYGAPDATVSDLRFSHSSRFLLYGSKKGQVRIAPLAGETARPAPEYWEATLHDSQRGAVNGVAMSFDDNYLLSVSEDGSFYVSDVAAEALRGEGNEGKAWEVTEKDEMEEVRRQHPPPFGIIACVQPLWLQCMPLALSSVCLREAVDGASSWFCCMFSRLRTSSTGQHTRLRRQSRRQRKTTCLRQPTRKGWGCASISIRSG